MVSAISALAFLAVVLLVIGIYQSITNQKVTLQRRLDKIIVDSLEERAGEGKFSPKIALADFLSSLGKSVGGITYSKKVEIQLSKADVLLRAEEFIGLNVLTVFAGVGLGLLLFGPGINTLGLGLIGLLMPSLIVYRKQKARAAFLDSQIAESLTGMSNTLRTGYSFQQAMDLVAKELQGPLGVEFVRTLREINLGVTFEQAMQSMIERVGSEDLELMISAVLIQRQIGGNLAEIFDNISKTIRQRIRIKGEVRTLTAQARISGLVIGMLPVAIFVILLFTSPSYISILLERPIGWAIMGGMVISELIGFVFMRKISNIRF